MGQLCDRFVVLSACVRVCVGVRVRAWVCVYVCV